MSVELPLRLSEIPVDNLVDIYRLFCKAYGLPGMSDIDKSRFEVTGIRQLNSGSTIDYRPSMGAKFFVQGIGSHTEFHGYSQPDDPEENAKASKFEKLVLEKFDIKQ